MRTGDGANPADVTKYALVVLGDEPAGLWLAERLAAEQLLPAGAPILWIRFRETRPIAVPLQWGPRYRLELGNPWSFEVRSRRRSFRWTPDRLRTEFPSLPHLFSLRGPEAETLTLDPEETSSIVKALRDEPRLLDWARALGREAFRARRLPPEPLLANLLLSTEMAWWDPSASLRRSAGEALETRDARFTELTATAFEKLPRGGLAASLSDGSRIESDLWIGNAPEPTLLAFCGGNAQFREWACLEPLPAGVGTSDFSITVDTSAVPDAAAPLVFWLDAEVVPDPERECWPIALDRGPIDTRLSTSAAVPFPFSSESLEKRLAEAASRLRAVFPHAVPNARRFEPPFLGQCAEEPARRAWSMTQERAFIPRYDFTAFRRAARLPALEMLLPSYRCDLPYPAGPLSAARVILERYALVRERSLRRGVVAEAR